MMANTAAREAAKEMLGSIFEEFQWSFEGVDEVSDAVVDEIRRQSKALNTPKNVEALAKDIEDEWDIIASQFDDDGAELFPDGLDGEFDWNSYETIMGASDSHYIWIADTEGNVDLDFAGGDSSYWSGASWSGYPYRSHVHVPAPDEDWLRDYFKANREGS